MKRILAAIVFTGTALTAADAPAQPAAAIDRTADANAIRAHIESIFQAFIDKDRQKLEETTARTGGGSRPDPAR